jgi:hypothetical protein
LGRNGIVEGRNSGLKYGFPMLSNIRSTLRNANGDDKLGPRIIRSSSSIQTDVIATGVPNSPCAAIKPM